MHQLTRQSAQRTHSRAMQSCSSSWSVLWGEDKEAMSFCLRQQYSYAWCRARSDLAQPLQNVASSSLKGSPHFLQLKVGGEETRQNKHVGWRPQAGAQDLNSRGLN